MKLTLFFRIITLILFSYFSFMGEGEARRSHSHRHSIAAKKKTQGATSAKRKQQARLAQQKALVAKRLRLQEQQRKAKIQRQQVLAKKKQAVAQTPRKRAQRTSRVKKSPPRKSIVARKQAQRLSVAKKSPPRRVLPPQASYLSLLNAQTQKNAKVGGLDYLFSKNLSQGPTVAVIEYSGGWKNIKNATTKTNGNLSDKTRENYKRNLLTPIGGPHLHPDVEIAGICKGSDHGSKVASVMLDLAPQAKVLPVSTYSSRAHSYDVADALLNLSRIKDVGVINISAGEFIRHLDAQMSEYTENEVQKYKYKFKWTFPTKYMEAFKAVARAGKVVVLAAGNEGIDIPPDEFFEHQKEYDQQFMGHLLDNLDAESLQSVVFAGSIDADTRQLRPKSNRPGPSPRAQDRFLCAPGQIQVSYSGDRAEGTSFAAPYICAAIANLSKPGDPKRTPRRALKALLDSADKHPHRRVYGCGNINARKALELLERQ